MDLAAFYDYREAVTLRGPTHAGAKVIETAVDHRLLLVLDIPNADCAIGCMGG